MSVRFRSFHPNRFVSSLSSSEFSLSSPSSYAHLAQGRSGLNHRTRARASAGCWRSCWQQVRLFRMLWTSFSACVGLVLIAGQVYGFGLFSDLFVNPSGLGLGLHQLEVVAVSENFGQYVRVVGGVFYDLFGIKWTIVVGLMLNSLGYLSLWCAVRAAEYGTWVAPFPLLAVFAFTYGQGAGWIETGVMSKVMVDCSKDRALASGLLKTFYGVASAFGVLIYAVFCAPSRHLFLLGLGIAPLVLGLPLLRSVTSETAENAPVVAESGHLLPWQLAYGITSALVGVMATHAVLSGVTGYLMPFEEHRTSNMIVFFLAFALLVAFSLLPLFKTMVYSPADSCSDQEPEQKSTAPVGLICDEDFSVCILEWRFWVFFLALASGMGPGLMILNNMGPLVKAFDGGSSAAQPACVSMFSVSSSIGRLVMGQFSARSIASKPVLLACALFSNAIVNGLFSLHGDKTGLLLAVPACGFIYGTYWPLLPVATSELFGLRSYGAKYSTCAAAAFIGSLPLNVFVVPIFYNASVNEAGSCIGSECFRGSLLCAAGVCIAGACLAFALEQSMPTQKMPTSESETEAGESIPTQSGIDHVGQGAVVRSRR